MMDTYGKKPEQLEALMMGLIEDLKPYPTETIERAFKQYRQTNEKIPTIAAIMSIVHDLNRKNSPVKGNQFEEKKCYHDLSERGKALFDEAMAKCKHNLNNGIVYRSGHEVPWYGKTFKTISDDEYKALEAHLIGLSDHDYTKALNYRNYLSSKCYFPKKMAIAGLVYTDELDNAKKRFKK